MTAHPRPTARLLARLALAGALSLGLAGGVASVASAAPAPIDNGRIDQPSAAIEPGPTVTVPGRPEQPDSKKSCDDDPKQCETDICDPKQKVLPRACEPDPCSKGGGDPAVLCPDPCEQGGDPRTGPGPCHRDPCRPRRGHEPPERCRPKPCVDRGDGEHEAERRRPGLHLTSEECPKPKGCVDESRCDRPVPGKPNFTG